MSAPYFPFFVDDYEADTAHLTVAEDGAYVRLLRLQWRTPGCKLPADDEWIRRKVRANKQEWLEVYKPVLREFFMQRRKHVWSARLLAEHLRLKSVSKKRSSAGKKGGRPRKRLESKDIDESPAKANQNQPEPEPEPYKEIRITTTTYDVSSKPERPPDDLVVVVQSDPSPGELISVCDPIDTSHPTWQPRAIAAFIAASRERGWASDEVLAVGREARASLGDRVMRSTAYLAAVLERHAKSRVPDPPEKPTPEQGFAARFFARRRAENG